MKIFLSSAEPFDSTSQVYYDTSDIYNSTSDVFNVSIRQFQNLTNITGVHRSLFQPYYPVLVVEMVLSMICLISTIVVYSILPEFKNLHGRDMISMCSSLLATFLLLLVDFALKSYISKTACLVSSIILHGTFLATFLWTQIMAYDICRKMVQLRPTCEAQLGWKNTYYRHSLYAWTVAIVVTLFTVVLDNTSWLPNDYKPKFGHRRCWLSGTKAFLIYFNAPVGLILLSNMIMFVITSWHLFKVKKLAHKMLDKQDQQRFHLYLKLFIAMGLIWIVEFLPSVTGIYKLYALAGIVTCLYGIILFVIFVCKKRILKQVWSRCQCSRKAEEQDDMWAKTEKRHSEIMLN